MRDFLISYGEYIVCIIAVIEFLCGLFILKQSGSAVKIMASCVSFGLTADACIIASGVIAGEGPFLHALSQCRYLLHGILVPLMIPIAFFSYGLASEKSKKIVSAVTCIFIAAGIIMGITTKTEAVHMAGVLRYAESDSSPVFATVISRVLSFGGVIPLIVVGIANIKKNRSVFLMLAGLFMYAFSVLAPATGNMDLIFLVTMFGEAFMVFFFGMELRNKKS